jgi:hypothetical protein
MRTIIAAAVLCLSASAAACEPSTITTGFHLLPWRQRMADRLEMLAQRQPQPISQQIYIYLVSPPQGQLPPGIQIIEQSPQGEPRQLLPVPGAPKQSLPIQGEPKQQFPIQGVPPQTLPIEGAPKQELPGGPPKQQLSPQASPAPSGYQRYSSESDLIWTLYHNRR